MCNHADQPFPFKAEVVFEFDKGYLEKASASDVEDMIGQIFTITTDDGQQAQGEAMRTNNSPPNSNHLRGSNPHSSHNKRSRKPCKPG